MRVKASYSEGKIIAKAIASLVDRAREFGCKHPVVVVTATAVTITEGVGGPVVTSSPIPCDFSIHV